MNSLNGFRVGGITSKGMHIMFALSGSRIGNSVGVENVDVPNYTEFTALFDQFRIDKVVVRLIFSNNTSTTASATTECPTLQICTDNDDASTPTSSNELLQRPECKIHQFGSTSKYGNQFLITCKPVISLAAYRASAFSAYATAKPGQWVNCAYPTTEHYGLKFWFDSPSATNVDIGYMQIYCDYYLSFKGVQ
jgi:hypothetical protein